MSKTWRQVGKLQEQIALRRFQMYIADELPIQVGDRWVPAREAKSRLQLARFSPTLPMKPPVSDFTVEPDLEAVLRPAAMVQRAPEQPWETHDAAVRRDAG